MEESLKVLIADDEPGLAQMLARIVECSDIPVSAKSVEIAMDGTEAQAKLSQDHYDLVLLDVHMPGIDGLRLLHWLRNQESAARAIVVMMSSEFRIPDSTEELIARTYGADAILPKPFGGIDKLSKILVGALSTSSAP